MQRDAGWAREAARRDGQSPPQTRSDHTPRPALTVRRSRTGYVLHDPALHQLTGLDALPLPFTRDADPADVLAHLQRLNPHRDIRFEDPRTLNPEL